jgi:hypothetical protein
MIKQSKYHYLILSRPRSSTWTYQFQRTDRSLAYDNKSSAMYKAEYLARDDHTKEFAIVKIVAIVAFNFPEPQTEFEIVRY